MRLESQNEMIKFFTSILVSAPKINTQTKDMLKRKQNRPKRNHSQLLTSKTTKYPDITKNLQKKA